jgi:hypothetical protein
MNTIYPDIEPPRVKGSAIEMLFHLPAFPGREMDGSLPSPYH